MGSMGSEGSLGNERSSAMAHDGEVSGPDLAAGVGVEEIPAGGMLLGHVGEEAALLARVGDAGGHGADDAGGPSEPLEGLPGGHGARGVGLPPRRRLLRRAADRAAEGRDRHGDPAGGAARDALGWADAGLWRAAPGDGG